MKIEVGGQIQGISLSSFLQIVQMDKTSCTLKIYANDDVGYLWLSDGNLVAAESGDLHGLDAVYEIICWNDTVIVIDNAPAPAHNITTPLLTILMEGLKLRDDRAAKAAAEGPSPAAAPRKKTTVDDQIAMQFVMEEKPDLTESPAEIPPLPDLPTTPDTAPPAMSVSTPLPSAIDLDLDDADRDEELNGENDGAWIYEYEDEDTAEPSSPIRTILIVFLLFLVISGGAFGGYIWYRAHALETEFNTLITDLSAMKKFRQQKTLLETYLDSHVINRFTLQVTEHLNEANDLIELTHRIDALPRNGEFIGTSVGLLKSHLKENRGTPFATAIGVKIKSLPAQLDDLDYKKLRRAEGQSTQARLGLYRAYLSDHPHGKHTRQVTNLVASVSDEYYLMLKSKAPSCYKTENWEPCISLADTFTAEFPEDSRFNEVWLMRGEMIDLVQFKGMREQAAGLSFADARTMYITYLQNTPHSTLTSEVRKEIASLTQKAEQQGQWNEVRTVADDPKKPINIRIQEVSLYMERYPDGAFIKDARALKQSLESQRGRLLEEEKASRQVLLARQAEARRIEEERNRLLARQQAETEAKRRQEIAARIRAREAEIRTLLKGKGDRFVDHRNSTFTDSQSGLTWMILDSKNLGFACMPFASAKSWVEALTTGGFTDWRIPSPNELALLYNGKPYYPTSGASWYWTSELETGAWGTSTEAFTFNPNNKETYTRESHPLSGCGFVHAVRTP
ncbi:DUF4388 domain-containing protein [Desulfoluna spongiiphila]|uniref:Uncharacterized protein n=1 Tax=Desulfoluna spongiiphila TaxID=419481 RepID=A0A1G5INQ2_9BACT|nr:DUF4388 domain-containing protein [Desulfoluna spongiiphila]SCY77755.1 protein of unknown function [Desulfoluna spongiiphila]